MEQKTNVMRLLDRAKAAYRSHCYAHTDAISGVEVAQVLGQNPAQAFKTLVTAGRSGKHYVFVIPVAEELDLKKAAVCAGEKSIEMVKSKDLLALTGYIHGGCSPIGMKKPFATFLDASAQQQQTIVFSAGKIGYQVETTLQELAKALSFVLHDLTAERETNR